MKIATDNIRTIIKHSRVLTIVDGPIVSAGPGYKDGTRYQVEVVSVRWEEGEKPVETHVWGHRILKGGDVGQQTHKNIYFADREGYPDWLAEIVRLPEVEVSPAAQIMNDIFANSPEFVEKMNAAQKK